MTSWLTGNANDAWPENDVPCCLKRVTLTKWNDKSQRSSEAFSAIMLFASNIEKSSCHACFVLWNANASHSPVVYSRLHRLVHAFWGCMHAKHSCQQADLRPVQRIYIYIYGLSVVAVPPVNIFLLFCWNLGYQGGCLACYVKIAFFPR